MVYIPSAMEYAGSRLHNELHFDSGIDEHAQFQTAANDAGSRLLDGGHTNIFPIAGL